MTIAKAPPKYASLAAQIREQIEENVLKPGDQLPTIAEMCTRHGVTPTTVTKVYSVLQQERLIECERGRGSFVAVPPSQAMSGVIGIYGCALANNPYSHPYTAELMRGFIDASSDSGAELLLLNAKSTRDWSQLDGVICQGTEGKEIMLRQPKVLPAVMTLMPVPGTVSVVADERSGIHALMEHLLAMGHRRIAVIMDPFSVHRLSAYRDALDEAGIELDARRVRRLKLEDRINMDFVNLGFNAMQQWLREDWRELGCTAIVSQNDDTANGVVEALRQAGIDVPGEVSVTGFDGTEVGRRSHPFLTTVEMPLRQISVASMELLLRQIAGEKMSPSILSFPVALKAGESTGPV